MAKTLPVWVEPRTDGMVVFLGLEVQIPGTRQDHGETAWRYRLTA